MKRTVRSQAYEGLQTAAQLRQEFLLVPAKVKDVYLVHLLEQLADLSVRSAIVFCSTCALCQSCKVAALTLRCRHDRQPAMQSS